MTNEGYSTRLLTASTWNDFATLVEANNGVWGGCWCMGFHVEQFTGSTGPADNRARKLAHVSNETCHQVLVYESDECVGWCQYGTPAEIAGIKNAKAYLKELDFLPDWRIGCIFTGNGHRGGGVARTAVASALEAIRDAGGGFVEAYPEQADERPTQRGAYFQTGPESLYAQFGFERVRRIAKWRWVMRARL
ncbi:MAG: family N-acetyltransferase [Subtercola sp.]|nr:family N-acetyltransferase [Subtercola sp.]